MIEFIALAEQCAPAIDKSITLAIVKQESAFNQYSIGINKVGKKLAHQPHDYKTAVITAEKLINDGYNIDMGYAQINSANLKKLGLTVSQIFEPCNNLKAMQFILSECYYRSGNHDVNTKLTRAFSCYNTGNHTKGFSNGYVRSITKYLNNYLSSNSQKLINSVKLPNNIVNYELDDSSGMLSSSVINDSLVVNRELSINESLNSNNSFNDVFSKSKTDIFQ